MTIFYSHMIGGGSSNPKLSRRKTIRKKKTTSKKFDPKFEKRQKRWRQGIVFERDGLLKWLSLQTGEYDLSVLALKVDLPTEVPVVREPSFSDIMGNCHIIALNGVRRDYRQKFITMVQQYADSVRKPILRVLEKNFSIATCSLYSELIGMDATRMRTDNRLSTILAMATAVKGIGDVGKFGAIRLVEKIERLLICNDFLVMAYGVENGVHFERATGIAKYGSSAVFKELMVRPDLDRVKFVLNVGSMIANSEYETDTAIEVTK